jgi:hypothetical protein
MKLVLVCISIFTFVFILWPSYVSDYSTIVSCNDGGPLSGTELDCGPPKKLKIGGGIKYVNFMLQGKQSDASSDSNHYFFLDNDSYFEPQKALIVSLISSITVAGASLVLSKRQYKKK